MWHDLFLSYLLRSAHSIRTSLKSHNTQELLSAPTMGERQLRNQFAVEQLREVLLGVRVRCEVAGLVSLVYLVDAAAHAAQLLSVIWAVRAPQVLPSKPAAAASRV
jgi:hypothetical protein